ncbi:MAG: hypothetical protein PF440_05575 [Thiomicrorhabdus sp.]|jgi:hypothetical protein|nr:hypothetical protein [Thiomicrorhabdus sp.]
MSYVEKVLLYGANGQPWIQGGNGGMPVNSSFVDELGVPYGVKHLANKVRVINNPYLTAVSEGEIAGHYIVDKFGANNALNISTYEDIWDGGGTYPYPADGAAPITHLYSTVVGDTQPIEVQGLDITGALVVQTVTLTGTTVVPLTTALWRIFRKKNEGTTDNAGIIHSSDVAKAVSYSQIQVGNNQTLMALYTVPLGHVAYLHQLDESLIGTTRAYTVSGRMTQRKFGMVHQLKRTFGLSSDGTSSLVKIYQAPQAITALTDIRISAISSAANGGMSAGFLLVVEPE